MTYTGYDGTNARGALTTSKDLRHFERQGIIVPPITYAEFVFLAESYEKWEWFEGYLTYANSIKKMYLFNRCGNDVTLSLNCVMLSVTN